MSRPAPRKSSLAGANPITPPPAPQITEPGPDSQPPAPAKKTAQRATKYPHKVSIYQDREDTGRVRGAILHTMATEGPRTLSEFVNHAVMAEVQRLEAKYNNGQPFPPVGARELPQGRPMGE
ncbi:MAG: ParB family protein [Arachnia sp.]